MKKCKDCKHFIGLGDFGTCCSIDYGLYYEDSEACDNWESKDAFTDNSKIPSVLSAYKLGGTRYNNKCK